MMIENETKKEIMRLESVSVEYPDFCLFPVDLVVYEGESVAVLGESGSGKTTLARAAACLLPEQAKISGKVTVCGHLLTEMKEKERKALRMEVFSMCFQNSAEWLNPALTMQEQLSEVLIRKYARGELPEQARKLMKRVGLSEGDLFRYPSEMSGGMIQRFMLAMAIALEPELVILDEPTSSLDAAAREEVIQLIRQIRKESGAAFLIITHDVLLARELCEKTVVIYNGQVIEISGTPEILHAAHHPYTRGLLRSFPELYPYRDLWGIRPPQKGKTLGTEHCVFYERCTQRLDACACQRPLLQEGRNKRFVACLRGGIVRTLSARGICKTFGKQQVLKGADLKIFSGEVVAVVGHSGAGKTTLCNILAGFAKADAGEILIDEKKADYEHLHKIKGGIQMVFQDSSDALNPYLTVYEAAAEPLRLSGEKDEIQIQSIVEELLQEAGLSNSKSFLEKQIGALSGGQKQRVNLVRALTMEPVLLIADEPTSMLDASSKANVMRLLKGLQNKKGCSLLLITHDLDIARKVADRVYLVRNGVTERVASESLADLF